MNRRWIYLTSFAVAILSNIGIVQAQQDEQDIDIVIPEPTAPPRQAPLGMNQPAQADEDNELIFPAEPVNKSPEAGAEHESGQEDSENSGESGSSD